MNGKCKYAGDINCPCGAWKDSRYGENWTSESYWCNKKTAGIKKKVMQIMLREYVPKIDKI